MQESHNKKFLLSFGEMKTICASFIAPTSEDIKLLGEEIKFHGMCCHMMHNHKNIHSLHDQKDLGICHSTMCPILDFFKVSSLEIVKIPLNNINETISNLDKILEKEPTIEEIERN